jgi:tRNA-modifying protein YgfZ
MSEWSDFLERQNIDTSMQGSYATVVEDVIVELKGEDCTKLLQGQITADVDSLNSGDFTLAALCTNKGRVVSSFTLYRSEDSYYCRLPKSNADQLVDTLKKYAVFYKVDIAVQQDLGVLVLFDMGEPEHFPATAAKLVHGDQLVEYWLQQSDWAAALKALAGSKRAPESRWLLAKIQMGWPDIRANTSEVFLPHALSLDLAEAISFTKGCYTGQEIVARTHYRGKSKKRLQHFELEGAAPESGAELQSDNGVNLGNVVISANAGGGKSELLASASLELPSVGEFLLDGSRIQYRTLPLPWQD